MSKLCDVLNLFLNTNTQGEGTYTYMHTHSHIYIGHISYVWLVLITGIEIEEWLLYELCNV